MTQDEFVDAYKAWNKGREEWHALAERLWSGEDVKEELRAKTAELDLLHAQFTKLGGDFVKWK